MARRRRRRKKPGNWFTRMSIAARVGICIGGLLLAVAASGIVYAASKLGKLDTEKIDADDIVVNEEVQEQDLGTGYLNVALFGVDSRSGELDKGTRTDCIIVASLNKETKEVRMVSVYRDTLLDIGGGTLQKCNAAYAFGGPTEAINMLNKNLDLDIQDYVTVDWGAISKAIDLLGGVDIDVQEAEVKYLNKFVNETARASGKKKGKKIDGPGLQHLNGVQATTYARIRSTAGGDFTRTERQRLVIEKIVEQAQKSDLGTINKIIDEVFPTIKTSFSVTDILYYAKSFMSYKLTENAGFPFDKTTATISGLGSIVIPVNLDTNVSKMHEFLFDKSEYTVSSTVADVSNAIVARVGQREVTDDSQLNSQTYTVSDEDKEMERQSASDYTSTKKQQIKEDNDKASSSGENSSSGNSSSGNSSSGSSSGNSSSGGSSSGSSSGGSSSGGSSSGGDSSSGGSGDSSGSGSGDSSGSGSGDSSGSGSGDSSGGSSSGGDSGGSSSGGSSSGGDSSSGGSSSGSGSGDSSGGSSSGGNSAGGEAAQDSSAE